jgi:hypothetical protein
MVIGKAFLTNARNPALSFESFVTFGGLLPASLATELVTVLRWPLEFYNFAHRLELSVNACQLTSHSFPGSLIVVACRSTQS